jgi:arsenate reductase-like glutaredoxin family protein|tara:strand:+ start:1676 stop:1864 length:189 start_codon:yes stop_codon:yes gene_type:complete
MIKVKVGKGALMFKEGTSDEEINKKLLEYAQFQVLKRPIVVRKSNGDEYQMLNGVRLNGKKH